MIKKLINKIKNRPDSLTFWKELERQQKIKKLGMELEVLGKCVIAAPDSDFKEIYRIAQLQQKLLTTK